MDFNISRSGPLIFRRQVESQIHAVVEKPPDLNHSVIDHSQQQKVACSPARSTDVECPGLLVKFSSTASGLWIPCDLGKGLKDETPIFLSLLYAEVG